MFSTTSSILTKVKTNKVLTASLACLGLSLFTLNLNPSYAQTQPQTQTTASTQTQAQTQSQAQSRNSTTLNNVVNPIITKTTTQTTYKLRSLQFTLSNNYNLQTSDYNQQLFFSNPTKESIVAIQTLFVPKAQELNNFIPQVQDNYKLRVIVSQDLTNVLKNIVLNPQVVINLNPLMAKDDRNIITYDGQVTVYHQDSNPNPTALSTQKFNLSGAEIYYGQYLYLVFALAPKKPVPFDSSSVVHQNITDILAQLKTLPLPPQHPNKEDMINPPAPTGKN